jgi:hypothetical protein
VIGLASRKEKLLFGMAAIGILCVIVGLVRQAYAGNRADLLTNTLYEIGVGLLVVAVLIAVLWKDN